MKKGQENKLLVRQIKKMDTGEFDKLEKILAKQLTNQELTPSESERIRRFRRVITLKENGYSDAMIHRELEAEFGISYSHAFQVSNEAIRLFGNLTEINVKAEKIFKANILEKIASELLQDQKDEETGEVIKPKIEKIKLAKECLVEAAKLKGLYEPIENSTPMDVPDIYLSDDPEIINIDDEQNGE